MSDAFTLDDAVAAMTDPSRVNTIIEDGADEAATDSTEISQADPLEELVIDDEDGLETAPEDDVEDDGEDELEDDDLPALEAPEFWDADDKKVFDDLDPKAQAILLKQETKFRSYSEAKVTEAANARKQAEVEGQTFVAHRAQLDEALEQAGMLFVKKWEQVNWDGFDAETYRRAKQAYEQDVAAVKHFEQVKINADQVAMQAYWAEEKQKLAARGEADPIAAKLIEPEKAQARLEEVTSYLNQHGFDADRLDHIGADELVIAYKAKLYDDLLAKSAGKNSPNGAPATPKPAQNSAPMKKPSVPGQTSTSRSVEKLSNRLAQTRSVDDAVALMLAKESKRK